MKSFVCFVITALLGIQTIPSTSYGHEGGHDVPGFVEAPKGGDIKAIDEGYVELLTKSKDGVSEITLYFYSKDLKPLLKTADLKVAVDAQIPRTKNRESLKLVRKENVISSKFNSRGNHRYTLTVKVDRDSEKTFDLLTFNVEPR